MHITAHTCMFRHDRGAHLIIIHRARKTSQHAGKLIDMSAFICYHTDKQLTVKYVIHSIKDSMGKWTGWRLCRQANI